MDVHLGCQVNTLVLAVKVELPQWQLGALIMVDAQAEVGFTAYRIHGA